MFLTVIIFFLVLGVLILAHEFGHFIMAKKFGMKVEEFGFFYPPRLFKIKRGETVYSFNLIPLGGFVKIKGEDGKDRKSPRSFSAKKPWQRALTIVAGVGMNFLLAVFLITVGYKAGLPAIVDQSNEDFGRDPKVQIIEVAKDSPAEAAGFQIGDTVRKINGKEITETVEVQEMISQTQGAEINFVIEREGSVVNIVAVPRLEFPEGEGPLGIALVKTAIISYPLPRAFWEGLKDAVYSVRMIFKVLVQVVSDVVVTGRVSADVVGPVGVAVMTGRVVRLGWIYVLQFTALLSINLAIINIILPFPVLDGGRLLFLGVEVVSRRPLNQKVERWANTIAFALLMALMVMISFRDVIKFGLVERIKQFF